jgi:hypothetical protein
MSTLETILQELANSPEPLLMKVLNFIRSRHLESERSTSPRIPGLHQGQIWMSEDFNEPLPDEFWLGEEQ